MAETGRLSSFSDIFIASGPIESEKSSLFSASFAFVVDPLVAKYISYSNLL